MKVSKEEIVGLLAALETRADRDHDADMRAAKWRTDRVVEVLADLPGVHAEHRFPDHLGRPYPTAFIRIDPAIGSTGAAAIDAMLAGDPPVAIMDFDDPQVVRVDVRLLSDPETEHVAARLRHVLAARG